MARPPGVVADRFYEARERRRHASAGHDDQIDLAPDFGFDYRAQFQAGHDGAEFGDEADAEAARHHVLDPVLPLALITDMDRAARLADVILDIVLILAIEAEQVVLAMHFRHAHRLLASETVAGRAGEEEAFAIEELEIEAFGVTIGGRHHRYVDLVTLKLVGARGLHALYELERHAPVAHSEIGQEAGEAGRTDRAHDAEPDLSVLES